MDDQLEEFLRTQAEEALRISTGYWNEDLSDVPRKNQCDPVANEFAYVLETEHGFVVRSPVWAPVNGAKHFVAIVEEAPQHDISEPIVVDATLKQFDETYPNISVKPISDPFIEETYTSID